MRDLIFDAWTPLAFKRPLDNSGRGGKWAAPNWVGADNQRRLMAYKVLHAYIDNAAREFLDGVTDAQRDNHREYGDAAVLRDAVLSALLGNSQSISVSEDTNAIATNDEGVEEDIAATELQQWFESWAEDERLGIKVQEVERDAVGLGDGVYVVTWSQSKERPRLRVFDPGFYFPVLHDENEDDYPERVHIAWEFEEDGETWVRRMTWELVRLEEPRQVTYQDQPAYYTCLFTDGEWKLSGTGSVTGIDDLTDRGEHRYLTNEEGDEFRDFDLGIDFIPVVHISNTVAVKEHFGQSSLAKVAQILDDLANADTDLQAASGTTGTPPLAVSGVTSNDEELSVSPGMIYTLGESGQMTVLDTSKSLDALMRYADSMMQRLSVNGRVPEAMLGRINANEVPSGVALALSFGPLSAMVGEMRLARAEKYQLLFKFVWRIGRVGGVAPDQFRTTTYEFGPFLPNDETATVNVVSRLLTDGAISLEQGVRMLRESGITDRNESDEINDIQRRSFDAANRMLDATGDPQAVYRFLQLNPEDAPPMNALTGGNGGSGSGGSGGSGALGSLDDDLGGERGDDLPPI